MRYFSALLLAAFLFVRAARPLAHKARSGGYGAEKPKNVVIKVSLKGHEKISGKGASRCRGHCYRIGLKNKATSSLPRDKQNPSCGPARMGYGF
jgi:hypothetical protein